MDAPGPGRRRRAPRAWRRPADALASRRRDVDADLGDDGLMPGPSAGPAPSDVASDAAASAARTPREREPLDPTRKAIELLTRREHSRKELARKLAARGVEPDAVTATLDDLAARGWQDDTRFADTLARTRAGGGHGPLRIRAELRQHGIADSEASDALNACDTDWLTRARDLLQRRYGLAPPADRAEAAKRGNFLVRRGFDIDTIRAALRTVDGDAADES